AAGKGIPCWFPHRVLQQCRCTLIRFVSAGYAGTRLRGGRNIAYQTRWAEGRLERLPGLAAELFALKLDVMLSASTPAALAARKASQTIPIVMTSVGDPVGTELVDSLARPGGNITGNTTIIGEMAGKRLELLKQLVPHLSRVAALGFSRRSYLRGPDASRGGRGSLAQS